MKVLDWIRKENFDLVVGVPCSELKETLKHIDYVPATREDEAIGIGVDLSGAENNTVTESIAAASGAQIIGYSLEEATAGGTFTMRLRL